MLHIRDYQARDADVLGQVFYDGVHQGAASAYTVEQCQAWCRHAPSGSKWETRLNTSNVAVAEWDGAVAGFMSLVAAKGLIDLAYVAPKFHRKGIASSLLATLEAHASNVDLRQLHTDASLLAQPMFAAKGWHVVQRQEVERFGVMIPNCRMKKVLS